MTSDTLPALSDIPKDALPGVLRVENSDREDTALIVGERVHAVYPHDEIYGQYCPVQTYVAAPPRDVYDYLADTRCLVEWTYSLRGLVETDEPGLWMSWDRLGDRSKCFVRTMAYPDAMTVDYHCAWDQGEHLWMIYLMRVVDAQLVLNKPGSVVMWNNCRHPFYDENPYPETAPAGRDEWVGDFWGVFPAGHQLEIDNLKEICEYRAANGLPITPEWMK